MVYGADEVNSAENVNFLLHAFDVWVGKDISVEFESILTGKVGGTLTHLLMFKPFENEGVNLFNACC